MPVDIAPYTGPVVVTLAYVLVYYGFVLRILGVKTRLNREYTARGERLDRYFGQDRELLAADRLQLNTLEHMGPFLSLLWLNAVFVGPRGATAAGAVYVLARAVYPFVMGGRLGRSVRGPILLSTVPGYLVTAYLVLALVVQLLA